VENDTSDDARDVAQDDNEDAFPFGPLCCEKGSNQEHRDCLAHSRRDCEQHCLIGGIPEAFDDEASEVRLQGVGHVVAEDGENKHPYFRVRRCFLDLLRLMMAVLDAGLLALESFYGDQTFMLG